MRNCPREDLGPYESNRSFRLNLGSRTHPVTVRQCPAGLITDRSRAFLELFFDCHSPMPGWSGASYVQHSWPTAGTLSEEHNLIVQAFRIIREEIQTIQAEQSKES